MAMVLTDHQVKFGYGATGNYSYTAGGEMEGVLFFEFDATNNAKCTGIWLNGKNYAENKALQDQLTAIENFLGDYYALDGDNGDLEDNLAGVVQTINDKIDALTDADIEDVADLTAAGIANPAEGTKRTVEEALEAIAAKIGSNDDAAKISVVKTTTDAGTNDEQTTWVFYQGVLDTDTDEQKEAKKIPNSEITVKRDLMTTAGALLVVEDGKIIVNTTKDAVANAKHPELQVGQEYSDGDGEYIVIYVGPDYDAIVIEAKDLLSKIDGGTKTESGKYSTTTDLTDGTVLVTINSVNGSIIDNGSIAQAKFQAQPKAAVEIVEAGMVSGVATPGEEEGADGQVKVTTKTVAEDGTVTDTVTYATPKNLKTVATTAKAEDLVVEADTDNGIAADTNAQNLLAQHNNQLLWHTFSA